MPVTDPRSPVDDHALVVDGHRALLAAAEQLLDDVDHALASLDDGSYGACDVCGAPVGESDLEEDPLLTRCSQHRGPQGE